MKKTILKKSALAVMLLAIMSCGKDDAPTIIDDAIDDNSVENTAPTIAVQTFSIDENSSLTSLIGSVVATDAENDPLTFSSTNIGSLFTLSNAGELTVAGELNFEVSASYTISVTVSDEQLDATEQLVINITDVKEFPIENDNRSFTVAEDVDDTTVIGNIEATDPDGDALNYIILSNPPDADGNPLFEISTTGDISLIPGRNLDFELRSRSIATYRVEKVNDDNFFFSSSFEINVTDVDENVTGGNVSTLASLSDNANLANVKSVTADQNGNVYATDGKHILKITDAGAITTLISRGTNGIPNSISFIDILIDSTGDNLFFVGGSGFNTITNSGFSAVYKYVLSTDTLSIFAGGNTSSLADNYNKMAIDNSDRLYVITSSRRKIFRISTTGTIEEIVQNSSFNGLIQSIAVDSENNVYASNHNEIYEIVVTDNGTGLTGTRTRFVGGSGTLADGSLANARFCVITSLVFDADDNLYLTDECSHSVRKIAVFGQVTTLAGPPPPGFSFGDVDGANGTVRFSEPQDISINRANGELFVADSRNHKIRKIIEVQ